MMLIWCILAAFTPLAVSDLAQTRIINGHIAKPHQFPYQVRLVNNKKEQCSGSLISNNYVLTAAHCVDRAMFVLLIFGAYNISDINEVSKYRIISEDIRVHEGWNFKTAENDIAIIKLPKPIKETKEIKIVPLAKGEETYENSSAIASGWGLIETWPVQKDTDVLRFTIQKIRTKDECLEVTLNNSETRICITEGACMGDSGGPLVVDGVQVGIASYIIVKTGLLCEYNLPSVYTRVSAYYDWITKNSDLK